MGEAAAHVESTLERDRRIAENESVFRDVNERIEDTAERFWIGGALTQAFLCECGSAGCTAKLRVTLEEYERVRSEPTHFLVIPGHEVTEIERVVRRGDEHVVVEKFGAGAEIALERDPRARP